MFIAFMARAGAIATHPTVTLAAINRNVKKHLTQTGASL